MTAPISSSGQKINIVSKAAIGFGFEVRRTQDSVLQDPEAVDFVVLHV